MSSRETILGSIRSHLAASPPPDPVQAVVSPEAPPLITSVVDVFKQNVEAVDGHCVVVKTEEELTRILKNFGGQIAISDAPILKRLLPDVAVAPSDVFAFDVGITTAQAAIADTGTLVLDSARERHRLVSLVPPVHIAIVDAATMFQTLGEALAFIHQNGNISPAVTFVTGPSRTADIELTLAIGVHGPQELYVIVNEGPALTR